MILIFWNKRTALEKLFIIIIGVLLIFGIYKSIQYSVIKYKYIKSELDSLQIYKDSLKNTQAELKTKTLELEDINNNAKSKAIITNNKLKKDAEEINNSTVTDSELSLFLAEYERKSKSK